MLVKVPMSKFVHGFQYSVSPSYWPLMAGGELEDRGERSISPSSVEQEHEVSLVHWLMARAGVKDEVSIVTTTSEAVAKEMFVFVVMAMSG